MIDDRAGSPSAEGTSGDASAPKRRRAPRRARRRVANALEVLGQSAQNAAELMRLGRLSAPYRAAFEIAREERTFRLRHYGVGPNAHRARPSDPRLAPILLVPPLMITTEVYDISPDLSSIQQLLDEGLDVWVTDFGAPEREEGGMERTLDDHVLGVSSSLDEVIARTGRSVHLAGYSQGGMFCYQVAAYRASAGVASLITFGSPVDIRRSLPGVSSRAAERLIDFTRSAIARPLGAIDGLPAFLTATGFKLLSVRKEAQQVVDFVASLHDRKKLEQRESRRRFLAGEGFVAWPGPSFRSFVDEFVVANRMASGGFVVGRRTVTLADISCPILYFVGSRDDIARPPTVRAIERAAPRADTYEVEVPAGHFGLVVGTTARRRSWPTVVEWVRWRDAGGPLPAELAGGDEAPFTLEEEGGGELGALPLVAELAYDVAVGAAERVARRVDAIGQDVGDVFDTLRWQLPRLERLRSVEPDTRIGLARTLAEQAASIPENTFFLWRGRAFSYREADRRVSAIVQGLFHAGVRPGDRVGVLMEIRPSYLSIVAALNRMGAVAVLLGPSSSRLSFDEARALAPMTHVVTDPETASLARASFAGPVLVLGGGPPGAKGRPLLPDGVVDLEAIDPASVILPPDFVPNDARARDLAMIIFTAGRGERAHAARITNRRWAFSALGAAAGCALTTHDTVYCCLPLHHAAGMLVAVGGALVGGARLAVAEEFAPERFVSEVHRVGASVVFYAGEMLRPLVELPRSPLDATIPVRLFAGSGMRADLWRKLRERYRRARVLDFYASTEGNAVLANTRGKKVGALGRRLPGSAELALVRFDHAAGVIARDAAGRAIRAPIGAAGALLARIDASHPMASFDGYEGSEDVEPKIVRDVFERGDVYFATGDLLRQDDEGDYWFVDRIADVLVVDGEPRFPHVIEDALLRVPAIRAAAVVSLAEEGVPLAAMVIGRPPSELALFSRELASVLPGAERPALLRWVDALPLTDGYRARKTAVREALRGLARARAADDHTLWLDGERYRSR